MKRSELERLREGRNGCPSDLAIDRLVADELGEAARREVEEHVAACNACDERVALRRAGFDAMEDVDPRPLLAGIRRRLDASPERPRWRTAVARLFGGRRGAWPPLVAAAAAAALIVIALPREAGRLDGDGPEEASVRRKGAATLHVHRLTGAPEEGRSEEVLSGERFRPGDRLRFVVDLPHEGHVSVVGVESDGDLYVAWPLRGAETLRPAGNRQTLPGAVALDATTGREVLYLVHCPPAAGAPTCRSRGAERPPACPDGCTLSPFVVHKEDEER